MKNHIEIAKKISSDLSIDYSEYLKEHNYFRIFEKVLSLTTDLNISNTLICSIIYSYSNSSKWIDLKADGLSINKSILSGLKADIKNELYTQFLNQSNEDILSCIGYFLDTMKSDWKFCTIRKMIDFHSKTMNQKEPDLTNVDEEKKPKVREGISREMKEALFQRESADRLIEEVEKSFVNTNHRTEQDFGVKFTDTEINYNPESWRDFIRQLNDKKKYKELT